MDQDKVDARWDIHTDRQLGASKAGALAVTTLNSGSWLALLTQAGSLKDEGIGLPIAFWGAGAFLGTLLWLFIYRGTSLQWLHDLNRDDELLLKKMNVNIRNGVATAIGSLICFAMGVIALSTAVW